MREADSRVAARAAAANFGIAFVTALAGSAVSLLSKTFGATTGAGFAAAAFAAVTTDFVGAAVTGFAAALISVTTGLAGSSAVGLGVARGAGLAERVVAMIVS
jgi:hypothetical protein